VIAREIHRIDPLLQSTYLGESNLEHLALAIHPATGDVYVAGNTSSTDLPGTAGGAQPGKGSGLDAFVARLPGSLASLAQATDLGATTAIPRTRSRSTPRPATWYVAGFTESTNFPGTVSQGG
jgi:hypothetical protein